MRKKNYLIASTMLTISVIAFLIFTIGTWEFRYDHYLQKIPGSELFMPILDELGEYEDIDVRFKHTEMLFFYANSIALYVAYDESQYEMRKTALFEHYTLLSEPVIWGDSYLIPEIETIVNGYHVYVVDNTEGYDGYCAYKDYCFPKKFGMIGFNDDTYELVYLFFYDFDLDLISLVEDDPQGKLARFIRFHFKLKP